MGGPGSSRWRCHTKNTTVEDCLPLTMKPLKKALTYGPGWGGTMNWSQGGEPFAWLSFTTESLSGGLAVRLRYSKTTGDEKKPLDYLVRAISFPVRLGGIRWLFLCPLVLDGTLCGRRSAKLYLPAGGLYFGCRGCHGLTYTSSQVSHKFDGLYTVLAAKVGHGMTVKGVKTLLGR